MAKIAVIGTGLAGLSAAWFLSEQFSVDVFERTDALGFGSQGVEWEESGQIYRVDIPPRVINPAHYVNLYQLLKKVLQKTYVIKQMPSFSDASAKTYLSFVTKQWGFFHVSFPSLRQSSWVLAYRKDFLKFFLWMNRLAAIEKLPKRMTIKRFLKKEGFATPFVEQFLYPMWALMCTCRFDDLDRYPASDLLLLFRNFTGLKPTERLAGGTKALEPLLVERVEHIFTGQGVEKIVEKSEGVEIFTKNLRKSYDYVIVATDPPTARRLLPKDYQEEKDLLSTVPIVETQMVLHRDAALMPSERRNWRAVNLLTKGRDASATIWMNPIEQSLAEAPLFQSWNPFWEPKELLISRSFQRVIVNDASARAMTRLQTVQRRDLKRGGRRIFLTGSYLGSGVPLLENAVRASEALARGLKDLQPGAQGP